MQTKKEFHKEYDALCLLPPHENIIHMWAFFIDTCDPSVMKSMKRLTGENKKTKSLFILMDEHPTNMADYMEKLVSSRGPKVSINMGLQVEKLAGNLASEIMTL